MKTVAIVPIKMNNERTPGKNTRKFDDGTPLIRCILTTLKDSEEIEEVYVYCSKEEIKEYMIPGTIYKKRDPKYDTAQADVNDMFYRFSLEVPADIYVLAHATAPFQDVCTINKGVKAVKTGDFDSAVAVKKLQEFLWVDAKPVNYNPERIPRTQDLKPMYVETTGLYIYTKKVIQSRRSRIGEKPYMLEVSPIEAIDINNPIDFEIANAINEMIMHDKRKWYRGGYDWQIEVFIICWPSNCKYVCREVA